MTNALWDKDATQTLFYYQWFILMVLLFAFLHRCVWLANTKIMFQMVSFSVTYLYSFTPMNANEKKCTKLRLNLMRLNCLAYRFLVPFKTNYPFTELYGENITYLRTWKLHLLLFLHANVNMTLGNSNFLDLCRNKSCFCTIA